MLKMESSVVLLVVVLAVFVETGSALRCWTCSSDLDPHCNDPFNASLPLNTHRYPITNCDANVGTNYPYFAASKPACKKSRQYVNGELVVIRGCTWKHPEDTGDECPTSTQPNYIRTTYCKTCMTDTCNGSPLPRERSLLLALVPLALVLLFAK